ncbi:hypothetical protein [Nocardia sp. NPDC057455]|uniref:hypothetical protein n=1 Tax=Nocardia sp. NPDC057455 TaxID=3346138 RepID=UPI00366F2EF9
MLHGREEEVSVIDRLLADGRTGRSGSLLITGVRGVGGRWVQVMRSTGIESEAHLGER